MNEIYLLNEFVINLFKADNLVNTITMVQRLDVDANKENIYPLVNLFMNQSIVSSDAVIVSFEIIAMQQRIVIPDATDSKLRMDTNFIDNMNEIHSICERFINVVTRKNNVSNIQIESVSPLTPLRGYPEMDGWEFRMELSIPNKGSSC